MRWQSSEVAWDRRFLAAGKRSGIIGHDAFHSHLVGAVVGPTRGMGRARNGVVAYAAGVLFAFAGCGEPSGGSVELPSRGTPAMTAVQTVGAASAVRRLVSVVVDTTTRVDVSWPRDSSAWTGSARPYPISDAVVRYDGKVAFHFTGSSRVGVWDRDGLVSAFASVGEDSAGARPTHGILHGSTLAHELVFFDVGRRRVSVLDSVFRRVARFSIGIGSQYPVTSAGVLRSGEIVLVVGRERSRAEGQTFRRLHDIVAAGVHGNVRVIRSRVEGALESVPTDAGRLGSSRGVSAPPQLRYLAKARYGVLAAAGGNHIFNLLGTDTIVVLAVSGLETGRWVRPTTSSLLEARTDTTFSAQELVPLGMRVDSDGFLWLERPRMDRATAGEWDIIGLDGRYRGNAATPAGCYVMSVGFGRLVCQFRSGQALHWPRLSVYWLIEIDVGNASLHPG